jgi:hypothetical protein
MLDEKLMRKLYGLPSYGNVKAAIRLHIDWQGCEPASLTQLLSFLERLLSSGEHVDAGMIATIHDIASKYEPRNRMRLP